MTTESIELWHRRARPAPTIRDFQVQLGCHVEEFVEMFDVLDGEEYSTMQLIDEAMDALDRLAKGLKRGDMSVRIVSRVDLLDSIADQVVTGIGVGHCAGMKTSAGIAEVNTSNWTKFDHNGQPVRDANGKIAKGPAYRAPELGGMV